MYPDGIRLEFIQNIDRATDRKELSFRRSWEDNIRIELKGIGVNTRT